MANKYKIVKLNENEYFFDTDLGLSYSIELKKSKAFYHTENNDVIITIINNSSVVFLISKMPVT